jgi:hypothetical protein
MPDESPGRPDVDDLIRQLTALRGQLDTAGRRRLRDALIALIGQSSGRETPLGAYDPGRRSPEVERPGNIGPCTELQQALADLLHGLGQTFNALGDIAGMCEEEEPVRDDDDDKPDAPPDNG